MSAAPKTPLDETIKHLESCYASAQGFGFISVNVYRDYLREILDALGKQNLELARLKSYLAGTPAAQLEGIYLLIDKLGKDFSSKPACEILNDELAARDKEIANLKLQIKRLRLVSNYSSLAERCFDRGLAGDALFEELSKIVGEAKISDCWWDAYDSSVEIVTYDCSLTREQADAILNLGFMQIYESPAGVNWHRESSNKCSTRESDSQGVSRFSELRRQIDTRDKYIAELTCTLKRIQEISDQHFLGNGLLSARGALGAVHDIVSENCKNNQ